VGRYYLDSAAMGIEKLVVKYYIPHVIFNIPDPLAHMGHSISVIFRASGVTPFFFPKRVCQTKKGNYLKKFGNFLQELGKHEFLQVFLLTLTFGHFGVVMTVSLLVGCDFHHIPCLVSMDHGHIFRSNFVKSSSFHAQCHVPSKPLLSF
jgi:hypothetical protein